MKEIIFTVIEKDLALALQTDLLSDATVKRRIDEMGTNFTNFLF